MPVRPELFNIIGMRLIKEFKTQDALKAFNESLKFNKENIKAWRNKANILNDKYILIFNSYWICCF